MGIERELWGIKVNCATLKEKNIYWMLRLKRVWRIFPHLADRFCRWELPVVPCGSIISKASDEANSGSSDPETFGASLAVENSDTSVRSWAYRVFILA